MGDKISWRMQPVRCSEGRSGGLSVMVVHSGRARAHATIQRASLPLPTAANTRSTLDTISSTTPAKTTHMTTCRPLSSGSSFTCAARSDPDFEVAEVYIGKEPFDPLSGCVRHRLFACLGLGPGTRVEAAQGFCGGQNAGIWFVHCPDGGELVMKLVEFDSSRPANLVEADAVIELHRERPAITCDTAVSFPFKVFRVLGEGGVRRFDLIVMRRAPGRDLAWVIGNKWSSGQMGSMMKIMYIIGAELREFHKRYPGLQHGDCQPSNIFYDELTHRVTFIDIGGMMCKTVKSDQEHFISAMSKLAPYYGSDFANSLVHFASGYNGASH